MKKTLLTLIFLFVATFLHGSVSFKNRLIKGSEGDYVITAQGSNYSLLLLRSVGAEKLILEEVMIDQSLVDLKKVNWKQWIEKKAPGASSWTAYVIDLNGNSLKQCYNHFLRQWILLENTDYYIGKLLTLALRPTRDNERKRIGPAPMAGEIDRRKLWKPQMFREGKKVKKPHYEVVRCKWPKDDTRLSGCVFELYLDGENREFPFPFWLEVQSPHYTFKVRSVDSGKGMVSPMPLLK